MLVKWANGERIGHLARQSLLVAYSAPNQMQPQETNFSDILIDDHKQFD